MSRMTGISLLLLKSKVRSWEFPKYFMNFQTGDSVSCGTLEKFIQPKSKKAITSLCSKN